MLRKKFEIHQAALIAMLVDGILSTALITCSMIGEAVRRLIRLLSAAMFAMLQMAF